MIILDPIRRSGSIAAAAVVDQSSFVGCRPALHCAGSKRPVAVLVLQDGATRAYEACGRKIDTTEFDRRYPGLRVAFERQLAGL